MKPPNGYDEIVKFYGWDTEKYLVKETGLPNDNWHKDHFTLMSFPGPMIYNGRNVTKALIHKKALEPFNGFLKVVEEEGLTKFLNPYAGCYAFRMKRVNHQLSMHSFGAAMDFNPSMNQQRQGIVTDWEIGNKPFAMSLTVVEIARAFDIKWGGDFDDPMHFQYGTGY